MSELAQLVPTLDGVEVIITASVGDPFLDEVIEGYSIARIFNSSLTVTFLGGSPQVFKPAMPFDVYVSNFMTVLVYVSYFMIVVEPFVVSRINYYKIISVH